MSSFNYTFLNLAAQSPTIELALSVTDKIQNEKKLNQVFYVCNSALKSCSVNIKNKKSICRLCISKAQIGINLYKQKNENVTVKYINRSDLENYSNDIDPITYKDLLLGVNSTIASQFRIRDIHKLEKKWMKYHKKMLDSSLGLFKFFEKEINQRKPDSFVVFNGRLSCSRPVKTLSIKYNLDYYLFDSSFNGNFPILAKNQMFHSIEFARKTALTSYIKNFSVSHFTAKKFMNAKLNKKIVNDKVYTSHQKKSYLDPRVLVKGKKIFSVFTSSDDEYKYIGSDWKNHKILNQANEIRKLIDLLDHNKYHLVVKMHPNQANMHKSNLDEFDSLRDKVLVLNPLNKSDTYELIRQSDIVITFCSSVGVEANFLRKKVIQIGPSHFMSLPVANFVKNAQDCYSLIDSGAAKLMPLRASIVWFTYASFPNCYLPSYTTNYDGKFYFNKSRIKVGFGVKILSLISKLIYNIERGNFDFIKNFSLYFRNFILSENRVK